MEDELYPEEQFNKDLEEIEKMDIPNDLKVEKGNALRALYQNQNKNWMIERYSIADHRFHIIGKRD